MVDCASETTEIVVRRLAEVDSINCLPYANNRAQLLDLRKALERQYVELYERILTITAKLVKAFHSRTRAIKNMAGHYDWAGELQSLRDADEKCERSLDTIHRVQSKPQPAPIFRPGRNELHTAAAGGRNFEVSQLLLENTHDIDGRTPHQWTALMLACEKGHTDVVNILLERILDLDAKNCDGRTALHIAVLEGHVKVVEALLKRKFIDADLRDNKGRTAFLTAALRGHTEIVRLLIKKGVDVNQVSRNGWTALHFAAEKDKFEVVTLLFNKGASPTARIKIGDKAGDLAKDVATGKARDLLGNLD